MTRDQFLAAQAHAYDQITLPEPAKAERERILTIINSTTIRLDEKYATPYTARSIARLKQALINAITDQHNTPPQQ